MRFRSDCEECGASPPDYKPAAACGACKALVRGFLAGREEMRRHAADRAQELALSAEGASIRCERDGVEQPTMEFYRGRAEAFRRVEQAIREIPLEEP